MASSSDAPAPGIGCRHAFLTIVIGASLAFATSAGASVLQGLTISQLRRLADHIVVARVVDTRPVHERGRVETEALVRVQTAWRGERGLLRVRTAGGPVGTRRLVVPGAPSLHRGDEVLLFLYEDGDALRPVGMFQGVWRVDGRDPSVFHASSAAGAVLVPPRAGRAAVTRPERTLAQLVGRAGGGQ